ncbi:MAG: hypothetical protein FWF79_09830 [Defluviitaleaceae bacterium]|nr:hypothetical protein [Defluviitaleaceae bacterium]
MDDSNITVQSSNSTGYILAAAGAALAVVLQVVYFSIFETISWVDAFVPGIVTGGLVLLGFKLGKGKYGKSFPILLAAISATAVVLGFSLGITLLVHGWGEGYYTLWDSFRIYFEEYLAVEFQGGTLYHGQGILDFGISIGLSILIVVGKYYYDRA